MTEDEYAENVGKVVEDEPIDRIEEIKARCDAATPGPWITGGCSGRMITTPDGYAGDGFIADADIKAHAEFIAHSREDIPFLLGEIERLKMMLDAAISGQETLQKQWAEMEILFGGKVARLAAARDYWEKSAFEHIETAMKYQNI